MQLMEVQREKRQSGSLAEMVVYVALCKTYLELRDYITIQLLPRKSYPELNNIDWEVDSQLIIQGENYPIDVSNSLQHIMVGYEKVKKAERASETGRSNPVLISRMSSKDVKTQYLSWNGGVCDLTRLLILDEDDSVCREAAQHFRLDDMIYWIPPLRIAGEEWDGTIYDQRIRLRPRGLPSVTHEDFAGASSQIPENVLLKVRGLVRSLYVGTEYRRAENVAERIVALLVQRAYAYLLRSQQWVESRTLIEYSERGLGPSHRSIFNERKESFVNSFTQKLDFYKEIRFLKRRGSRYAIDDAIHPMHYF